MHIQIKTKNMADPENQQDFKVWISNHSQAIDWFSQDFKVWAIPNQKWMHSQGFKAWMKTNIYCTKIHDMPFCQYIMLNLTFDNIFQYKQFFHVFIHQLFFHDFRKMRIFAPRRLIFWWTTNSNWKIYG